MEVYDEKILSQFLAVSTSNVSDALDRLHIAGAPQGILPLFPTRRIVGHAATLKLVVAETALESAVNGTLAAIVKGGRGAVLVIDGSSNPGVNSFGGIAGATSKHHGLVGCVSDSVMRDLDEYRAYDLPVYAKGITQRSIRGRSSCAGHGIEVTLGGVTVRPADLVIADENGVCVVPQDRIREVLEFAQNVKATEERLIAEIRAGADPIAAHERVTYDSLLKAR
jgi:4-hydroxy-4-methyl-2-oxoglutarate aldolase